MLQRIDLFRFLARNLEESGDDTICPELYGFRHFLVRVRTPPIVSTDSWVIAFKVFEGEGGGVGPAAIVKVCRVLGASAEQDVSDFAKARR